VAPKLFWGVPLGDKEVYTFDASLKTIVKIVKRGSRWAVYKLEKIVVYKGGKREFFFEEKASETWSYKPFEDKDVSNSPEPYFEDVKRWQPWKITHRLFLGCSFGR